MVNKQKWVSYDNERSVKMKADLAWDKNLAGVMVWSIETDDFNGRLIIGQNNSVLHFSLQISSAPVLQFLLAVLAIMRKRSNVSNLYSYKR